MLERASCVFMPKNEEISIYAYLRDGWQRSDMKKCSNHEYSRYVVSIWQGASEEIKLEHDNAAAARAVACVMWEKEN